MTIQVDLNARILPDQPRAFLARPGKSSRYFDHFRKIGAIGPDLPFVNLREQLSLDDNSRLRLMLRRAQAYRRWRDGSTRVPEGGLTAYRAGPYVRQDTAAQFQAILRGYFERARKGDLVLIPPSAWQADAILAEFSTGRRAHKIIELPYFQDNVVDIPARSFREITTIPKRLLPRHILDKVVKPNAFIQFDKYDTLKLQELAYKSFIRSGEYNTEFRVTSDNHNLNENMHFVIFVKSIAACMKALSEHRREPYSIQEIVAEDFGDFVPNLHANVNSPGWLRLTCKKSGPHIASIIYELFVELGRKALDLAKTGLAIVHDRRSKSRDKRILEIERDTIDVLKMLALSEDVDEIHKMIINRNCPGLILPSTRT